MALEFDELAGPLSLRRLGSDVPSQALNVADPANEGRPGKVAKEKPKWGEPGSSKKNKEAKAKAKTDVEQDATPVVETPHGEKKKI